MLLLASSCWWWTMHGGFFLTHPPRDSCVRQAVYAERYAFLVSDANLQRYGIQPQMLAKYMQDDDGGGGGGGGSGGAATVDSSSALRTYAIFLASIGGEADRIKAALPRGRGFTCFDTSGLPGLFRTIFTEEFGNEFF
jgi:hypothetical protein